MSEKSFVRKHIVGWVAAIIAIMTGTLGSKIYAAYRGPVEAQIAAQQTTDSNTAWALHTAAQNDLFPLLIGGGTFVIVLLFLLPTIVHAFKMLKE